MGISLIPLSDCFYLVDLFVKKYHLPTIDLRPSCLFVCLSVGFFVCLSVCLFVCLFVSLFVCLSVCLFVVVVVVVQRRRRIN